MEPNADPSCIFCRIVSGEVPCAKVLETDEALGFLDVHPVAPGHLLLIPKRHVVRLDEMNASQAGSVLRHLPALGRAIRQATGCAGYNILNNNERVARQEVMHVHFHIIPRWEGDAFHIPWPAGEYGQGELEQHQAKIRAAMES